MSEANRVSIIIVPETTYGTTPANSDNWVPQRFTSESLAANPQTVVSDELRSDRMIADLIKTGEQIGGDMNVELSAGGTFDALLEAAMQGSWSSDVLQVGSTRRSFSIQKAFNDFTSVPYLHITGARVNGFNFTFPYGQLVTGGFSFLGNSASVDTTNALGTGTLGSATTTEVLNGSSDVSSIQLNGATPGSVVRSIQLNVDNGMRPIEGLGSIGPMDYNSGRSNITGQIEIYFDDLIAYNALINNTAVSLVWTVSDGTNTLTFDLPNIKFNSGAPNATGVDTDVVLTLPFTALFDATKSAMRITRS